MCAKSNIPYKLRIICFINTLWGYLIKSKTQELSKVFKKTLSEKDYAVNFVLFLNTRCKKKEKYIRHRKDKDFKNLWEQSNVTGKECNNSKETASPAKNSVIYLILFASLQGRAFSNDILLNKY